MRLRQAIKIAKAFVETHPMVRAQKASAIWDRYMRRSRSARQRRIKIPRWHRKQ